MIVYVCVFTDLGVWLVGGDRRVSVRVCDGRAHREEMCDESDAFIGQFVTHFG